MKPHLRKRRFYFKINLFFHILIEYNYICGQCFRKQWAMKVNFCQTKRQTTDIIYFWYSKKLVILVMHCNAGN